MFRNRARWIASVCLVLSATLPGCIAFHSYRDVRFHLVDAESSQPVASATIGVRYQGMSGMIPEDVSGLTDPNGLLKLRVGRDDFAYIEVTASGFQSRPTDPELFHPAAERELRLYRLPLPYHHLVVPTGARGLLELRVSDGEVARLGSSGNPPSNGQRAFRTTLSTTSVTYAQTLPRMGEPFSDYDRIFAASFDDGREAPLWCPGINSSDVAEPQDHRLKANGEFTRETSALWLIARIPLGWGASRMLFYAGTLPEADAAQKQLVSDWQKSALARQVNWAPLLPPLANEP